MAPADGSPARGDAAGPARSQPRSAFRLIAPATDRSATKPEFISRGNGQFVGTSDAVVPANTFKGTDGVTINLLNAPIAQAAKTVLGDMLKADYVISDKVTGTVTVQTSAPVEPAAVADIFEAVLKTNGIALIRDEGHYRLAPLAAAAGAPVSFDGQPRGPGITTRIVPLKYIAAAEMRRVIEPMFDKGAILRVDDQRNLMVVNGTGRELANLDNLVSIFDVDWMRQMSFAVFPVKTAEPDVVALLGNLYQTYYLLYQTYYQNLFLRRISAALSKLGSRHSRLSSCPSGASGTTTRCPSTMMCLVIGLGKVPG